MPEVNQPFKVFDDLKGEPLESGYIYIGSAGLEPSSSPISIYYDSGFTVPAPNPLRTIAGYPSRGGSPARVYVQESDYSILVRDKKGALVYSSLSENGIDLATFNSVSELQSAQLTDGQVVTTPRTKWQVTSAATYTLPYVNRSRTFNNLAIGGGLYATPIGSDIYAEEFLDIAVDADNDTAVGLLASVLRDGHRIDFGGKMFRVYDGNAGILSSTATPATDRAQSLTEMLYLNDLQNITFGPGGLYAADQSVAGAKYYFPSTLYIKGCEEVHFEPGATFEGKGESWGDSDASVSLSKADRQDFLGQNGGHAIVAVRSKRITGTPTARLCGSVGSLYFSSCQGVELESPFSNPSSLGYAAYAFDAWTGTITELGIDDYHGTISNPIAHRETLTRREDGAAVGSTTYCGKGGVLTEDAGVYVTTTGGYIADMYGNGSAKTLGYAFGAAARSICKNTGAVVRNCQEVVFLNHSVDDVAVCEVYDVDAVVGLTGIMFDQQSFGESRAVLTGKLRVNDSRVWVGENETLANTSVVAAMKTASRAFAKINLDAAADPNPPAGSTGIIFTLISNQNDATYGGVTIDGGRYETNGYLIRSEGWGGASAGTRQGLIIQGGARIIDLSSAALDGFLNYQNQSATAVFTFVYHDLRDCFIRTRNWRTLDWTVSGAGLEELNKLTTKLENCYSLTPAKHDTNATRAEFVQTNGLAGPDSLMVFKFNQNRLLSSVSYIVSDTDLIRILGPNSAADTSSNELKREYILEGDVRTDFTATNTYKVIG